MNLIIYSWMKHVRHPMTKSCYIFSFFETKDKSCLCLCLFLYDTESSDRGITLMDLSKSFSNIRM